jgi:hypothetical protein
MHASLETLRRGACEGRGATSGIIVEGAHPSRLDEWADVVKQ